MKSTILCKVWNREDQFGDRFDISADEANNGTNYEDDGYSENAAGRVARTLDLLDVSS
jgi:hypothetical protein